MSSRAIIASLIFNPVQFGLGDSQGIFVTALSVFVGPFDPKLKYVCLRLAKYLLVLLRSPLGPQPSP